MPPPATTDPTAGVAGRILVSMVVCALITWQLFETASFPRPTTTAELGRLGGRIGGGTRLQWFLLALMLLSALEGIVAVALDVAAMAQSQAGPLTAAQMQLEVGQILAVGQVDQAILSVMIIGLGVSSWRRSPMARAAVALGTVALLSRRLPAPLVLVGGVSCLQRAPSSSDGGGGGGGVAGRGCCSLRCALRPLLGLALVELLYALYPTGVLEAELHRVRDDPKLHARFDKQMEPVMRAIEPEADVEEVWRLLDTIKPEQLIDVVQQSIGEVVELGATLALGLSGRAHGLKHTWMPMAAAFVPGLPVSFSVVFYFLLETRHTQHGGTLLPLRSPAPGLGKST